MDENVEPTPDDDDTPERNPRLALLIGLGGLTAIAVILLAVRAAKPRSTVSYDLTDIPPDADWRSSMQHLADAVGERMDNLEQRFDNFAAERVQAATTSVPSTPITVDPIVQNGAAQAAHVSDVEPGDAPQPAAVSLPPQ